MRNNKCFIIQPFDGDKFDKRYYEVFKPAIERSGFSPYRVDEDSSVDIPIEEIQIQIKNSVACFAEITTNNPNVWYELGFASAYKKPICIVCSEERNERYPFDVQQRLILKYKTESMGDYKEIAKKVTNRLLKILERSNDENIETREETSQPEKIRIEGPGRTIPERTKGYSQEVIIGDKKVIMTTREFSDGTLGDVTIFVDDEEPKYFALMNSFTKSVSIGLRNGVPLDSYVNEFIFSHFEPSGHIKGHDYLRYANSPLDFAFRDIAITYLDRRDLSNLTQEEKKEHYKDIDDFINNAKHEIAT